MATAEQISRVIAGLYFMCSAAAMCNHVKLIGLARSTSPCNGRLRRTFGNFCSLPLTTFDVQRKSPYAMARRQCGYLVVSLYCSLGAPGSDSTLLHVRGPRC